MLESSSEVCLKEQFNRESVAHLDACNLNHEHGGAQDVTGIVSAELDTCVIAKEKFAIQL